MLLAINSGKGHIYKGKTIEDIDLSDMDIDSEEEFIDEQSHDIATGYITTQSPVRNIRNNGIH